jgi:rod shape-determining protein MreB
MCIRDRQCPAELVADLVDHGLVLTGGGARLRGIDQFFSEELNIPVRVAQEPHTAVVRGAAICLDHLAHWRDALEGLADAA